VVELRLEKPAVIDHAIIVEDIREGERVLEYVLEAAAPDGTWKEIAGGSAVGRENIDGFPSVEAARVRWRCTDSMADPIVRRLAVFRAGAAGAPR
jgi:alpha-L-fucosidase